MKSGTQYFRVVNLEKYQHYTKRNPPWIKLHASTLEDYDFACLQDASKMHLCAIWVIASRTDNRIPWDAEWIAKRINATSQVDLTSLQDSGFIELIGDASNTLAACKQSAPSETETETETETEKPPARKLADVPKGFSHWYDSYPRKHGKLAAVKAWKKINPSNVLAAQMAIAIRNQVAQHHFQNGRGEDFIPNPSTWLNQGRWDDEIAESPQARKDREFEQKMKQVRMEIASE